MILKPHGQRKERVMLTAPQIAAILGLEDLVIKNGLVILCPRCAAEGDPTVDTDNSPDQPVLKIDCQCRERRVLRKDITYIMDGDGDLIAQAEKILAPVSLSVRCPQKRCRQYPLEIERTPTVTVVRCRCAKTTLHPPKRTVH